MKNKFTILTSLAVACLVVLVAGTTYAYWRLDKSQTNANVINSSCLDITIDKQASDISLQEAYPISDAAGLALQPFTFTVKNNCTSSAYFSVNLEMLNDTTLKSDYVKAAFNEASATKTAKKLTSYTQYTTSLKISGTKEGRILASGVALTGGATKSYELRLWMDQDVTAVADSMNKTFKSKIVIEGTKTA